MTLLPPPQYDMPPSMPVLERVLPYDEVERICKGSWRVLMPGEHIYGCARAGIVWDGTAQKFVPGNGCVVVRVDEEAVRRHELGHCNGWPANHPMKVKQASPVPAAASKPAVAAVKAVPEKEHGPR